MPKRSCPFPSTGQQLKMHVDIRKVGKEDYQREVYAKTSQMLTEGAKQASKAIRREGKGKKNVGPVFGSKMNGKCAGCNQMTGQQCPAPCSFCEKDICSNCTRVCEKCEGSFCLVCSVLNYDEREERAFCLSCCS